MTKIPVDPASVEVCDGSVAVASVVTHINDLKRSTVKMTFTFVRNSGVWTSLERRRPLGSSPWGADGYDETLYYGDMVGMMPSRSPSYWDSDQIEYYTYQDPDGQTRWMAFPKKSVPPPPPPRPQVTVEGWDKPSLKLRYGWLDSLVTCRCCCSSNSYRRLLKTRLFEEDEALEVLACPDCHMHGSCVLDFDEPNDLMIKACIEKEMNDGRSLCLR